MNYVSIGVAFLALGLIATACLMPYWTTFAADAYSGWPQRQWGLLKVSGKFTNVFIQPADIAWMELRDTICQNAAVLTGTGGSSGALATNGLALATAVGNSAQGVSCTPMCKTQVSTRCSKYYAAVTVNFVVFGLLVAGGLVSLVGAGMPLIGKERKKDRTTWLLVDVVGFLLAAAGCTLYILFTNGMLNTFRQSSWFQMQSIGWCFYLAAAAVGLLLIPVIIQMVKVYSGQDKKSASDSAQLLTAGASPDFLMPTAI